MEPNPQLEQTHKEALVIPRWLWSTVVGLVLIAGGVWLILSRFPIDTTGSTATDNVIPSEPAPLAGHPAPDFELKNLEGEIIRFSDFKVLDDEETVVAEIELAVEQRRQELDV